MSRIPPVLSPSGIRAISPSQIDTYRDCPRKWGLRYIDGLEAPPAPSAELGTRAHAVGERYFKSGILPDFETEEGRIFGATLTHWPDPRKVTVESERDIYLEFLGVPFHGFQDVGWIDSEGTYWVGDLKTTSDFRYAKTQEVLQTDPQALVYGLAAVHREGVDHVGLKWVYSRTRGANKALPVAFTLDQQALEEGLEEYVIPLAKEILLARELPNANELPQNPATCPKYGGCWYGKGGHCKVDPIKALGGLIMSDALKARLAAAKKAQESQAKAAGEVPLLEQPQEEKSATEVPINPPTPQPRSAIMDRIRGMVTGETQVAQPAQTKLSEAVKAPKPPACVECGEVEELDITGKCKDCAPPVFPVKPSGETTPEVKVEKGSYNASPVQAPVVQKGPDGVVSNNHGKTTPGGRAFDAYRTFRGGKNHDGTPTPTWDGLTEGVRQGWEVAAGAVVNAPVLLVDCIPDGPFQDVRVFVERAHDMVRKDQGVVDYRLVDFGKGAGMLVVALQKYLQANPHLLSGYLYADTRDPAVGLCVGLLSSLVDTTIRAAK